MASTTDIRRSTYFAMPRELLSCLVTSEAVRIALTPLAHTRGTVHRTSRTLSRVLSDLGLLPIRVNFKSSCDTRASSTSLGVASGLGKPPVELDGGIPRHLGGGRVKSKLIVQSWALYVAALGTAVYRSPVFPRINTLRWQMLALCAAIIASGTGAACRGGDNTGPALPDINGNWRLNAVVRTDPDVACFISGTIAISQSSQDFHGQVSGSTVVCYTSQPGDSTINGSVDGPFTDGKIIHNVSISFSEGGCYFSDGLISPASHVFGALFCNLLYKGHSQRFNGTFDLDR